MRNANEDFIICSLCMAQVQQKYGWYTLDNVLYYATHIACRDIALESPERVGDWLSIYLTYGVAGQQFKTLIPETLRFELNDEFMASAQKVFLDNPLLAVPEERITKEDPSLLTRNIEDRTDTIEAIRILLSYCD